MAHEDYKELLSARALDALACEEARALDTHLESCAECRAELIEWEHSVSWLAHQAGDYEPSAALRGKILSSIRATDQGSNQTRAGERAESKIDSNESKVLPFERRPVVSSERSWGFGAIAAGLVIAALSISLFVLWQQNRGTQTELARVSSQMDEANAQLARNREAVALLSSPGARMAMLAGTKDAPGAQAMLAYDKNGHAMLMARGLPSAPQGMAYQLWFIKDGKKMPGKVFTPDAAGNGVLEDEIPSAALESAVFAVTLEPEGGVPAPTGAIFMVSGA